MNSLWGRTSCLTTGLAVLCSVAAAQAPSASMEEELHKLVEIAAPRHPRLFFTEAEEAGLRAKIESDPLLDAAYGYLQGSADAILAAPPVKREVVGRRLLGVSRTCLQRVSYLAFAYRMTKNEAYLRRAEEEMLAAAAFEDWNPGHFLDVAEMTAALAIGYDWLYNGLAPGARTAIKTAIVDKGLNTSMKGSGGWIKTTNNWNQVCHGGLVTGALAVLKDEPDLARQVIARAVVNVPFAMHEYEPDGVYPEGPSYWEYGTTYNIILISALESVLDTDFGLASASGFLKTPEFYLHATGPTGLFFNFSDCGPRGGIAPAMHWLAQRRREPDMLWREKRELQDFSNMKPHADGSGERMLPFLLIWAQAIGELHAPRQLHWHGDGPTPVAMHRNAWEETATYVAIKGGSPSTNHGHMDTGSFVLDMDGVRWALDLGGQDYHGLESIGINLWNMNQNSERWTVFRLSNLSHNTLVVDGRPQLVKSYSPIIAFSDDANAPHTIVDMTPAYEGQLAEARRGVRLLGKSALVQDEVCSLGNSASVRWGMVTGAKITISDSATAILEQDGRTLSLRVLSPESATLEIYETENPPHDYDAKNPNTRMIGFKCEVGAASTETLAVFMKSGEAPDGAPVVTHLEKW
ncbi:MAG TPA: heparinase II/III family protein [Candidatus Hydrogenedentes bacterium]|nr:heparinase II/III family protein [Candidatus Hydrogenedentota bacterium]HQH50940.1 heparinase II/III family protein [Candidatus Hydrogenedentota bacterium]